LLKDIFSAQRDCTGTIDGDGLQGDVTGGEIILMVEDEATV
jgi:hypothetical protein